ncbi:ALF repeat-containing protein, partial [Streptomyces sp. NPDC057074]|uniref:ALF repeat-containing protein n=1 Tax=Streptomyces sp. NPDC057074 TaxID=3346015 RepID=UPI003629147D
SPVEEVREAAEAALDGDAATVTEFVDNGQYEISSQYMRTGIAQIISTAGPILQEAGRAALNSNDPKKYSEFLTKTQFAKQTEDERVRAAQLVASGGPEVQGAARVALAGSPQMLHAFIVSGQYTAMNKDQLAATHVAIVQKMISDAAGVAATAQKNAAEAQRVAALARKAATEAADWADKAKNSAQQAQDHADQAAQYAREAESSAAKAAASAKTARNAAKSADVAAADAARSATDATLSAEWAQSEATSASYAASRARQSALEAGKSADAALADATAAFKAAVTKAKEEAEARRKAAVAAKEKAINDNGARAREQYRCQNAYIPCDPVKHARWCQHNEILCEIEAAGPAIGAAGKKLWGITKELTGLSNYTACLAKKDLDNCGSLAVDALIGAKLKALDAAYDKLKLIKRGCKIASKSAMRAAVVGAASAEQPCGTHDVPGMPRPATAIPRTGDCKACAERIRDSLGGGEIVRFDPPRYFGPYRGQDTMSWTHHYVVVLDDRVYDAFTPSGGEAVDVYKSKWLYGDAIEFGF